MDIDELRSQTKERAPRRDRRQLVSPILIVVAVIVLVGAGFLLYNAQTSITRSGAHAVAVEFIETSEVLHRKLGGGLEIGLMPIGNVSESTATITYRVTGVDGEARVHVMLGKDGDSWRLDNAIMDDGVTGPLVLVQRQPGDQGDEYRPDPRSERHVLRGAQLVNSGRSQEALKELELAVAADHTNPEAWYWRGRAYQELDQAGPALADFQKTLELSADHTGAHEGAAEVLTGQEQYEQALVHLDRVVELEPEEGYAWHHRGYTQLMLGKAAEARADAEKACSLGFEPGCEALSKLRR